MATQAPPPPVSNPEAIQAAQEAIATQAAFLLRDAVSSIDPAKPAEQSLPALTMLAAAVIKKYGQASAALSATHYEQARLVAGIKSRFTTVPADTAPLEQIGATVGWATAPLRISEPDIEAAQRNLIAGVEKLVLDAGRNTTVNNVLKDTKAVGWYRVTEPDPCAFCALLATRGLAYRSEKSAEFKAHDHCRCYAAPSFGDYQMSDRVQEWQDLYHATKTGGAAKTRRAFRNAFDLKYATT